MNDATRELGAALGIAVLGSIAASQYSQPPARRARRSSRPRHATPRGPRSPARCTPPSSCPGAAGRRRSPPSPDRRSSTASTSRRCSAWRSPIVAVDPHPALPPPRRGAHGRDALARRGAGERGRVRHRRRHAGVRRRPARERHAAPDVTPATLTAGADRRGETVRQWGGDAGRASGILAALALAGVVFGAEAAAVADAPPGVLRGEPLTVRVRPLLGEVPMPSGRPSRAERTRPAARARVAACDPTAKQALKAAPSASAGHDPADSCVVAAVARLRIIAPPNCSAPPQSPAATSSRSADAVAPAADDRRSCSVSSSTRAGTLDGFVAAHFHGKVAVTLNGATVATMQLEPNEAAAVPLDGEITGAPLVPGSPRRPRTDLCNAPSRTRASEQLVGLLDTATMTTAARRVVASLRVSIDDKSRFVDRLPGAGDPDSLVLGCFGQGTTPASCASIVPTSPRRWSSPLRTRCSTVRTSSCRDRNARRSTPRSSRPTPGSTIRNSPT